MNENAKKYIALGIAGLSFIGAGFLYFYSQTSPERIMPKKQATKSTLDIDLTFPQQKDINNICGIAKKDGEIVAISSNDVCPTSEALAKQGYTYISITDNYRPKPDKDFCGMAHYDKETSLGEKDLAKLESIVSDLENIHVEAYDDKCPTQSELSDMITSSMGVPVRFLYNEFNANPENYPVVDFSSENMDNIIVDSSNSADEDLSADKSDYLGSNGINVPKILVTKESSDMCNGDYKNCIVDDKEFVIYNTSTKKEYRIWTRNGYALPKFMMTRGAWDVCGGIFSQCDYTPDEKYPNKRGTVKNIVNGNTYTSKEIYEVEE